MGYSISWLAVKGLDKKTIYGRAGVGETGDIGDRDDYPASARELGNGWTLLLFDRCEHPLLQSGALAGLSANCSVVACNVDEDVMFASAEVWQDGAQIWSVRHLGDREVEDLDVKGIPPDEFAEIERRCRSLQAQESDTDPYPVDHFFDIPLELAKRMTWFRHDESDLGDFRQLDWKQSAGLFGGRRWWPFGRK